MNSFLDPVGTRPPTVYWRRRALIFAAAAVAFLLLMRACSSNGPPDLSATTDRPPVPLVSTFTPTPDAVIDAGDEAVPGVRGGGSVGGGAGAGSSSSADPDDAADAEDAEKGQDIEDGEKGGAAGAEPAGSASPSAGADGKKPGAKASASPSPTSDSAAAGPLPCARKALAVALRADEDVYSGDEKPRLFMAVTNTGKNACLADLGSKSLSFTVSSGDDRIWSSDDCQGKGRSDVRLLEPGQALEARSIWGKVRSGPGCPKGMPTALPGTYILEGSAGGVKAKERAVFRLA